MHASERVAEALALAAAGRSASQIARRTGLPRSTVRDWLAGRIPRGGNTSVPSCAQCGALRHEFEALPPSYPYLLGMYLGDGCISRHARGVHRLRISLDASYPAIIAECARAVAALMPDNRVGIQRQRGNWVEVQCYSKSWPCLFPQHGPGKKHERRLWLAPWQQAWAERSPRLLLRGLIHSDGCRFTNTGRGGWRNPRYAFNNLSPDIRRIFCDTCDRIGVRWTASAPHTIYVSRKADVALLDEFVGPKR